MPSTPDAAGIDVGGLQTILFQHFQPRHPTHARLPGRKSDVQECQWLLKLHAFGLLNNSFQPTNETRIARTLWRHRGNLVAEAGSAIQRMQKALTEMNIQLANVLSDLSAVSGMKILGAILEGSGILGSCRFGSARGESHSRGSSEESGGELARGTGVHSGAGSRTIPLNQKKIVDCDLQLRKDLESFGSTVDVQAEPLGAKPKGKKGSRNVPQFDLRLWASTGQQINGIDVLRAQTVIAEAGADLSVFPGEKQFASWLRLCPTHEQSGGKILNRRTCKVVNRATVAFRNTAASLLSSQSYLGAQYPRLRTRLGAPKAITAMALKLACLFYRLLKQGQQYVDKGTQYYETRYREQHIRSLAKPAEKLGLQLVIPEAA